MLPDKAAELLQWEERGEALTERCMEKPDDFKALQMVMAGFEPKHVARLNGYEFDEDLVEEEEVPEDAIRVWVCKTPRCRNKEKVATATDAPTCPICGSEMDFLMHIQDPDEISHMTRIGMPRPNIRDPLERTDRTKAPDFALGDD